jgi:hypothetical protein
LTFNAIFNRLGHISQSFTQSPKAIYGTTQVGGETGPCLSAQGRPEHRAPFPDADSDQTRAHGNGKEKAMAELKKTVKLLDQMAAKGVIHANKAANNKSKLTRLVNNLK